MSDGLRHHAFVFAGGGTGGHIFPAIAIAEQLLALDPDCACTFVCSTREIDASILRAESLRDRPVSFLPLNARPFGLRPLTLARFVWNWGASLRTAREHLRQIKARHSRVTLVAMGGFVAAPMAQAARVEKIPVVMVNLDAVPGRANRWISSRANAVFTATPLSDHAPAHARTTWTLVPPIVRSAARCTLAIGAARESLRLDPARPVLLVTGASQGAGSINELMIAMCEQHALAFKKSGWQIIHQTGKSGVDEVRAAYARASLPAIVEPFFREMGRLWRSADFAVSRAGAGSVAEAWANAVPTVFLPYPYHKDEHQRYNAIPLVNAGAAKLFKDHVDAARNLADSGTAIAQLLNDAQLRAGMRCAFDALGPADGGAKIAAFLNR